MGMIISPLYIIDEAHVTHGKSVDLMKREKFHNAENSPYYNKNAKEQKENITNMSGGTIYLDASMIGADANDSAMKMHLELYDKAQDEAALLSENIVEIYNNLNAVKVEQAFALAKKVKDKLDKAMIAGSVADMLDAQKQGKATTTKASQQGIASIVSMCSMLLGAKQTIGDISDDELKKYITEEAFIQSDDPNTIRAVIKGRIAYNNAMVACFRAMLNQNYDILGISKSQAELLSSKLDNGKDSDRKTSIKEIKEILKKNEKKFIKDHMIDMRPLGGGCFFVTDEVTNLEDMHSIDRMIQLSFQYDAIVLGHGGSKTKAEIHEVVGNYEQEIGNIIDREKTKYEKVLRDLGNKSNSATAKAFSAAAKQISAKYNKLSTKLIEKVMDDDIDEDDIRKEVDHLIKDFEDSMSDLIEAFKYDTEVYNKAKEAKDNYDNNIKNTKSKVSEAINKINAEYEKNKDRVDEYISEKVWMVQPIYTLNGGPFTVMDDLVRQLIKEGFKNIMIMACNPGHHTLAKDILDHKDVKIHHSENVTLIESSTEDPFANTINTLNETENHLISMCESAGCSYNDFIMDENSTMPECILTEATGAGIWAKVKEYATKAWNFLVGLFKRVIDFFRGIIRKIKEFFSKTKEKNGDTKFKQKIKTSGILIENATVKEFQVYTWEDLEKSLVSACETISKHIQQLEKEQVENMKKLEQYAEKMEKEHQSSQNESFDSLVNLMFGY